MLAHPDTRVAVVIRNLALPRELVEARAAIDALEIETRELCAELQRLQHGNPPERFRLTPDAMQNLINDTNERLRGITTRQLKARQAYRSQHAALVTAALAPLRKEAAEKILTASENLRTAVAELQSAADAIHEVGGQASAPPSLTIHHEKVVAVARSIIQQGKD